ncbi:MAG TPA: LTA synthase family protein [Methylomirabilota bacterium]|nr:LTA synthase family protein [Methylomirabilota bacterium]
MVVQQAQRVFLLGAAALREPPSPPVLGLTLYTGLRADLVTASAGMLVALATAVLVGAGVALRSRARAVGAAGRTLGVAAAILAVVYVAVLTVDMGYYLYSGQRLDAVFMEYVTDLVGQGRHGEIAGSQVAAQTAAEASEVGRWAGRVAGFAALMTVAIVGWRALARRRLDRALAARPRVTAVVLPLAVLVGAWGAHPGGPDSVQSAPITSGTYYALAQSPIWHLFSMLDASTKRGGVPPAILAVMPEARAVLIAREVLAPGARFVSPRWPLVHVEEPKPPALGRKPNVLLIFVEALDRRFLGRTVGGRRLTPFLDGLRDDGVYFEHFHANGANTFNGLFASLCSSLPRYGTAATKARYANDYLCLPTLLGRGGYRTRMVIGQNRDRSHSRLGLFMARNGLDELIDDRGFPRAAPRMGLGLTDGALFDRLRAEIDALRAGGRPYFLATLTTGTHHPFAVPATHPDVAALRGESDRYLAALRYLDLELERFFAGLRRDGALRDTVVLVLGDHGRHERVAPTDLENEAGHFMVPLVVWLDPSLRSPATYRPRVVPGVASQLDLTPTIAAWAGVTPRVSSFAGRDLGCALVADCLPDRAVYLNEVYDHGAGLADRDGFWFYSFPTRAMHHIDLALRGPARRFEAGDPATAARVERILALYVTANELIERNALWNWKEFADRL